MYSRNTRIFEEIGIGGHQEAVSVVRICWENVKNRTNCSTKVPQCGLVKRDIAQSTKTP